MVKKFSMVLLPGPQIKTIKKQVNNQQKSNHWEREYKQKDYGVVEL